MTGKEIAVRDELRRMYFGGMVPREVTLERKNGETIRRERVLFAGYVFVDMAMTLQAYYKIRDIPHVIKWLGGGSPLQLSAGETKHVEWLANGGKPLEPSELDEDGIVKTGPLKGRDLDVVAMNKRAKRAKLRITLGGEPHEISLSVTAAAPTGGDADEDNPAPSE
jgi:transcriptional antiterminator NusG